jgi:hypothetical protein
MATGAVFTIITNDGKQERILNATAHLHDRLATIQRLKLEQNMAMYGPLAFDDIRNLPTLVDIEKTHVLFTNAHFKPFAAIGLEYSKVACTSGVATLGSTLTFSIPQFGDFFHDISFHCVLQQPTLTVDNGVSTSDAPAMRWCSWPGERLLKSVSQEVNNNPLDKYSNLATVSHREYRVAPNKRLAWMRCVGQQEETVATLRQPDWVGSGSAAVSHQLSSRVTTGPQTPSSQKTGTLELIVPLLFWYNKDIRLAVPSIALPFGQRFINIDLAPQNELVGLVPRGTGTWSNPNGSLGAVTVTKAELYINNIFMNPEIHKIYIQRVGFSLIRVHREQTFTADKSTDQLLCQNLKWPIEYMFVGCKVKDYYAPTSNALMQQNLDSWDKYGAYTWNQHKTTGYNSPSKQLALNSSATALSIESDDGVITLSGAGATFVGLFPRDFPTETGVTGASNGVGGPGQTRTLQTVPANTVLEIAGTRYKVTANVANGATTATVFPKPPADVTAVNPSTVFWVTDDGQEWQSKSWRTTLDSISLVAHGVDIFKEFPSGFYNAYLPYHYGGPNLNAPTDVGSLFVTFCLYPGTYQPSGHINLSRAREFYIKYSSSVISNTVPGYFVIIASAINFLLITDGSAILRYST